MDNCPEDYPFEYLGNCYNNCPLGTIKIDFMCYDCIPFGKCVNMTTIEFKDKVKDKIASYSNSSNIIEGSNFIASILSSNDINHEELLKNGISSFDLGNCTNILKDYYRIDEDENLYILNMEIKKENNETDNNDGPLNLVKYNQLGIFDKDGEELDLSICKEDVIFIQSLANEKNLNLDKIKNFENQGIDVFNSSDKFFNDICHPYNSENDIDIIIKDRRNDIYKDVNFCRIGCNYGGINYTLKAVNCICNTTYIQDAEINITTNYDNQNKINFKNIKNSLLSSLFSFNIDVLKCYNLIFNLKILVHNIGFYCLFFMLLLQIIFFFIYLVKKLKNVKNFMISLNRLNNKNKKSNKNKTDISIIKNQIYKRNNNSKFKKYKHNLYPPKKSNNKLNELKNINKKNRLINLMNSKSNAYSTKSLFASKFKQSSNIYMKESEIRRANNNKNIIQDNNSKIPNKI